MKQPHPSRIVHSAGALASAVLWGLFEVIALARSRWATRLHHGHDV